MADSKAVEQLKRQLYFDLRRDETMAMNEYLVSPISKIDLRNAGKAGGGMMSINDIIRPIGMAAGGPIPPEPKKTEIKKDVTGTESLLMDFIGSKGMFAPSGKKFDTSDSPMIKDVKPIGLLDDAADLRILSMKLVLKEAADSLKEMDRIDKLSPDEIIKEFEIFIGSKGA